MIEVTIADIVPMPREGYEAIILLDSEHHRVLPLTVSRQTGSAIRSNLKQSTNPPQGSFGLTNQLLMLTGAQLEKIRLTSFPNRQLSASHGIQLSSRLVATLSVKHGKKTSELETWVDHAIPLAACASAPIYVEETLLETIGKPIPEDLRDAPEKLIQALTTFVFQKDGAVSTGFQQAVQQARENARRLRTTYVGSEHLLLGLLSNTSGPGIAQLQNHGIDPGQLKQEIENMLKGWQLRPGEFQRVIQAQSNSHLTTARHASCRLIKSRTSPFSTLPQQISKITRSPLSHVPSKCSKAPHKKPQKKEPTPSTPTTYSWHSPKPNAA